jgi:HNH endonuclease
MSNDNPTASLPEKQCTNLCKKCKKESPVSYYKNRKRKWCTECTEQAKKEYYRYHEKNTTRAKERMARLRKEDPEKVKEAIRKHYHEHPEKYVVWSKNWIALHPEEVREIKQRWRKNNPEKVNAQTRKRRTRIKTNGGKYTKQEWSNLCALHDFICLACHEQKPLTPDHVIPISKGGHSNISNIQPLCLECNIKKGQEIIDYRSTACPSLKPLPDPKKH